MYLERARDRVLKQLMLEVRLCQYSAPIYSTQNSNFWATTFPCDYCTPRRILRIHYPAKSMITEPQSLLPSSRLHSTTWPHRARRMCCAPMVSQSTSWINNSFIIHSFNHSSINHFWLAKISFEMLSTSAIKEPSHCRADAWFAVISQLLGRRWATVIPGYSNLFSPGIEVLSQQGRYWSCDS